MLGGWVPVCVYICMGVRDKEVCMQVLHRLCKHVIYSEDDDEDEDSTMTTCCKRRRMMMIGTSLHTYYTV